MIHTYIYCRQAQALPLNFYHYLYRIAISGLGLGMRFENLEFRDQHHKVGRWQQEQEPLGTTGNDAISLTHIQHTCIRTYNIQIVYHSV
jgi:hypothetical protein